MSFVDTPTQQRLVLHNVAWSTYESLLDLLDSRALRIAYDRGRLEMMVVSFGHEHYGELLGRLILVVTEELQIPIASGGSTTCKESVELRGIEADKCFWIEHEAQMRGKQDFDARRDPPPDLAIEIDLTSSSLDRLSIYSSLKIPEIWRYDGSTFEILRLGKNGRYRRGARSRSFPGLPPTEILTFLERSNTVDETTLVREFRQWVRDYLVPGSERARPENAPAPPKLRTNGAARPKRPRRS
jgi:Uma2 family endonuclease